MLGTLGLAIYCVVTLLLISTPHGVLAQDTDLSIPPNWQKTSSPLTRSQRAGIAKDAIGLLLPQINASIGTISAPSMDPASASAALFAVLALNDWINGNTAYRDVVLSSIQTFGNLNPNFLNSPTHVNSDTLIWGLTATYAYRAYKDPTALQIAVDCWNQATRYAIPESQAQSQSIPARNFTFPSTCSGSTVAGAVFWLTDNEGDDGVNGETVGPYLALSAYLFEATFNNTYGIAAEATASFIQNHMYNGDVVQDFFNVKTCVVTTRQTIPSYDTGFAIEGLASWANISGNATWGNLTKELVSSSAVYSVWTGPDGVIIEVAGEGQPTVFDIDNLENGFKAFFMRGLHEAWLRIPNSPMSKYIEAYITVQYNALLTMTSNESPGKVYYNSSWTGPAPSELHPYPQVIALHLLNPALDISQRDSPTVPNSSSPVPVTSTAAITTASSSASTRPLGDSVSPPHIGVIVGGVVGGVIVTLALAVSSLCYVRKRRRRSFDSLHNHEGNQADAADVEPFVPEPINPPPRLLYTLPSGIVTTKFRRDSMEGSTPAAPAPTSSSGHAPSSGLAATETTQSQPTQTADSSVGDRPVNGDVLDPDMVRNLVAQFLETMRQDQDQLIPEHDDHAPPAYER